MRVWQRFLTTREMAGDESGFSPGGGDFLVID